MRNISYHCLETAESEQRTSMSSIPPELHVNHRTALGPTESRSRMLDHQYRKVVDLSVAASEAAYGADQTLLDLSGPLSRAPNREGKLSRMDCLADLRPASDRRCIAEPNRLVRAAPPKCRVAAVRPRSTPSPGHSLVSTDRQSAAYVRTLPALSDQNPRMLPQTMRPTV